MSAPSTMTKDGAEALVRQIKRYWWENHQAAPLVWVKEDTCRVNDGIRGKPHYVRSNMINGRPRLEDFKAAAPAPAGPPPEHEDERIAA